MRRELTHLRKVGTAILGPGNIGTDLMYKVVRSRNLELRLMSGVDPKSEGLALAASLGVRTSTDGVSPVLDDPSVEIVFDATSARIHLQHAPLLKDAGKRAIDLTPAAIGPYVVPCVNIDEHADAPNINLITCGGQATIPIVAAVSRVTRVRYAEIVATISSRSAGPGTRQNIDEFTQTTARGLVQIGGAERAKAIIILNPAEPPIMMRNTIYTVVESPDIQRIRESVSEMVHRVKRYVPGYRLKMPPMMDGQRVIAMIEVEGAGDYLPKYSGNLDIITAAAVGLAELLADRMLDGRARE
ncbi:MAG: acetaldehyde dehydrogenase (acetylating) [Firmicutes bacterium]|jgi:acetaldehyde dehydrogenase|nr:acetaldehyde dehydrogenase (acetylating) [Bacillota bacterium]